MTKASTRWSWQGLRLSTRWCKRVGCYTCTGTTAKGSLGNGAGEIGEEGAEGGGAACHRKAGQVVRWSY